MEVRPCPQSATEVHWSTSSILATATDTSYLLRPASNPNFPAQFSVAACPVLRLLLGSSHRQLYGCENRGSVRQPWRTEAVTLTHTCGLVDLLLFVRMVKMENNPLIRNLRVNVVLGGA